MKTYLFTLLLIVGVVFTACDLSNESNYTPDIFLLQNPIKNHKDTLNFYSTDNPRTIVMDTLQIGDTVVFHLYLDAFTNNIRTFMLSNAPDSVAKILLPSETSMDTIFAEHSEYNKGKFYMDGINSSLYFPFSYVALKSSKEAEITLSVVSDAVFKNGFGANSKSLTFKTPIKN